MRSHSTVVAPNSIAKSIRPPGADHGLPHRGEPGPGQCPNSVKRGLRPRSDREPIWESDSSDLLACIRTHSDAEWLRKGGAPAALGGKASTSWMAATGFPNVNSSGEDINFV